jgi:hypothetical protein
VASIETTKTFVLSRTPSSVLSSFILSVCTPRNRRPYTEGTKTSPTDDPRGHAAPTVRRACHACLRTQALNVTHRALERKVPSSLCSKHVETLARAGDFP